MKRFPGYDRSTSRSEWAAFGCLGAVAVATILLSLSNANKFAVERNDVITAWSSAGTAEPAVVSHRTNHMLTKVTHIPSGAPAELPFAFRGCAAHETGTPLL